MSNPTVTQNLRMPWFGLVLLTAGMLSGCSLASFKQRLAPDGMTLDRYPQIQREVAYRCGADELMGSSEADCELSKALASGAGKQLIDHDLHFRFLQARRLAMSGQADPVASSRAYFKVGKTLIQTLCNRWFDNMELEQRRLDGVDKSFNVWKAFGTTLLGLGNANSTIVSLYGGATTLDSGLSTAYKDVYLLGGSIAKVKLKMFGLIDEYALGVENGIAGFEDAYVALERMGTLCSPSTAKLIIDSGIDAVNLTVNSSLKIVPSNNPATLALAEFNALAQQRDTLEESQRSLASRLVDLRNAESLALDGLERLNAQLRRQTDAVSSLANKSSQELSAAEVEQLAKAKADEGELEAKRVAANRDLELQRQEIAKLETSRSVVQLAFEEAKKQYDKALKKLSDLTK